MKTRVRESMAIAIGAIGGALSRYFLAIAFSQGLGTAFPFGTFFCNLSGCFGMGFLITLISERWPVSSEIRLMLSVGFLGSYTTFSAYQMDADTLLASGRWELTFLYWIGSAVLGILLLELGAYLARRISSDRGQ